MVPLTILIVDDDDLTCEALRLLMMRDGYDTKTAMSGKAAITLLDAAEFVPNVVLTDLQMPGVSGSDLASQLRKRFPEALLLAMSGSSTTEEALAGFDGFLQKPFSMETLSTTIANRAGRVELTASPNRSGTHELPVLDEEICRKMQNTLRPEKLAQLYALCVHDVRRRIAIMSSAVSSGDDETYRQEAHAIKGGCGMVGAIELQTIAASAENTGIPANHVATLDEFLTAVARLEGMLVANSRGLDDNAIVERMRSNA